MKILFYNIFEGCSKENQFQNLITFINKESPDILAFSEANHWEDNNFEKLNYFLEQTVYKNYIFSKSNTDFNLILFSKFTIQEHTIITKNIWHSILKVKINDINYFILHLNPKLESARIEEINELFSKYVNFYEKNIFMGDFNSLSKSDKYNEKSLKQKLLEENIIKFLDENNNLTFKLHLEMNKKKLIDNFYTFNSSFKHTVPTKINSDKDHITQLRLDFFYMTKEIDNSVIRNEIIITDLTNSISDHYPILLEFLEYN